MRTLVETGVLEGRLRDLSAGPTTPRDAAGAGHGAGRAGGTHRPIAAGGRLLQTAAVVGTEVPLPCCRPSPSCPKRCCMVASPTSGRRVPLRDAALSRARVYLQARPDPRGRLWQPPAGAAAGLHAHIVEALEAPAPERVAEQVERLAHHALRGEVWDKAWRTAGRRGESHGAVSPP